MKKSMWMCAAAMAMCMAFGTTAVAHDKGHDKKDRERWEHREHRDYRGGYHKAKWDRDHDGDHNRRPPGWDKGNKKGWGDCNVPPGQAKKHGCYDRDRDRERRRREQAEWRRRHQVRPRSTTGWHPMQQPQKPADGPGTWHRPGTPVPATTQNVPPPAPTQQGSGTWRRP